MSDHHHHPLKFFHVPDGRKCHIAPCPREAERMRKRLEALYPEGDFELYIHGSAEHVRELSNFSTWTLLISASSRSKLFVKPTVTTASAATHCEKDTAMRMMSGRGSAVNLTRYLLSYIC